MMKGNVNQALIKTSFVIALFVINPVLADERKVVSDAQQLILNNNGTEAYLLLKPYLSDYAGSADFDYIFGIAALDAGRPSEAIFAFERVLDIDPGRVDARAELAKAYYLLGENDAAKDEFQTVKKSGLPENIENTIDLYLSAIEFDFKSNRTTASLYAETGLGYDSNVNSATDTSNVAIPALGNLVLTLSDDSLELSSGVAIYGGGFNVTSPIRPDLKFYVGADIQKRNNWQHQLFSNLIATGTAGFQYYNKNNQFRLASQFQNYKLNRETNRNLTGGLFEWQHKLNSRTSITSYTQYSFLRYPTQKIRDANQFVIGIGASHAIKAKYSPLIYAGALYGQENQLEDSRDDLGKDYGGIRFGGSLTINKNFIAYANANYQYSEFQDDDPIFLKTRQDHFINMSLGGVYIITPQLTLRPEVIYSNNISNIALNEYDRWAATMTLRYNLRK